MSIVGIGVDLVDVARFERQLARTPRLRARLFAAAELVRPDGAPLALRSLAGRFAAKEAFFKALGDATDLTWHDLPVVAGPQGDPAFDLRGTAAAACEARGIRTVHLSMSHDAGLAIAYVVAES